MRNPYFGVKPIYNTLYMYSRRRVISLLAVESFSRFETNLLNGLSRFVAFCLSSWYSLRWKSITQYSFIEQMTKCIGIHIIRKDLDRHRRILEVLDLRQVPPI